MGGLGKKGVTAAAVGLGIAAVELFHIELSRRKRGARTGLRAFRTEVAFVGRIAAPFAKAAPQAAQESACNLCSVSHQSSPWAAPEWSAAHCVAMYGDS